VVGYLIIVVCVVPHRDQASTKPCTPICTLAARFGDGQLTRFSYSKEKDSVNTSWSHPPLRHCWIGAWSVFLPLVMSY